MATSLTPTSVTPEILITAPVENPISDASAPTPISVLPKVSSSDTISSAAGSDTTPVDLGSAPTPIPVLPKVPSSDTISSDEETDATLVDVGTDRLIPVSLDSDEEEEVNKRTLLTTSERTIEGSEEESSEEEDTEVSCSIPSPSWSGFGKSVTGTLGGLVESTKKFAGLTKESTTDETKKKEGFFSSFSTLNPFKQTTTDGEDVVSKVTEEGEDTIESISSGIPERGSSQEVEAENTSGFFSKILNSLFFWRTNEVDDEVFETTEKGTSARVAVRYEDEAPSIVTKAGNFLKNIVSFISFGYFFNRE